MNELKPCPFCGKNELETRRFNAILFSVACLVCGIEGPADFSKEKAANVWNKRPGGKRQWTPA